MCICVTVCLCVLCIYIEYHTGCITLYRYFFSNIMSWRPFHLWIYSLFTNDGWFSTVWISQNWFWQSLNDGHVGHFWMFTTFNNISVNTLVHAPVGSSTLSKIDKWESLAFSWILYPSHTVQHNIWLSISFQEILFRWIWIIKAHLVHSSSCFSNRIPIQTQCELRLILPMLRTEAPPKF